ncbi:putative Phosphorylated CTD interacting factor 1 WW domain containing protein [Leishmania utingensis]|uniref:Phosphorylated CTD interacting factor 1 WW domain containing protein n=1 Tax=Leishmania utingensis TaxID=653362 RepID=A0AAW3AQU8_9TRYP
MHVRTKRDGVAEVFERNRVALIMQQALAKRYAHPLPSPLSDGVRDGRLVEAESGSTVTSDMASKSPSSPPRLTSPLHYTLRRCSRTEFYLHPTSLIDDTCPGYMESSAPRVSPSVSAHWQSRDDEACVATAVAAECWRHATFTALTQTDLRRLCGLSEETVAGVSGHQRDSTPSSPPLPATPVVLHLHRSSPPLVTHQEFFEMPPRWVMQSLGEVDQHTFHNFSEWDCRRRVTPLDVGATVVKQATNAGTAALPTTASTPGGGQTAAQVAPAVPLYSPAQMMTERGGAASPSSSSLGCTSVSLSEAELVPHPQARFRVRTTATMAHGGYWVDVVPLTAEEVCEGRAERVLVSPPTSIPAATDSMESGIACERVDRDALLLRPPAALYVDPLLPCDELYSERGVNTSVYVFFLRAVQRQRQNGLADRRISHEIAASDCDIDSRGMRAGTRTGVSSPSEVAASLAVRLSLCARQRRLELARRIDRAIAAENCSSALQRAPVREAATLAITRTAVASAKCSGLSAPAVSLQVRVDHARGSLQLRALILEGAADCTTDVPASEWDTGRPTAAPTSSTLAQPPLQETGASPVVHAKRRRDPVDGEEPAQDRHRVATTTATQSPTVEVLLRSAWKLAALYDMTRSAALAQREAERDASEEGSEAGAQNRTAAQTRTSPLTSSSSRLATSLMARLTGMPQAASALTASGTSGANSEVPCGSSWSTVVLHAGSALLPSTVPVVVEKVPCPAAPSSRQIDHPIAASPDLLLADGDPPTGVLATPAIPITTLTTTTTTVAERVFLARLFTLLLRYRTLFGEHGRNQGPQAAVPPPVMEHLAATFEISAEAFASPLNTQLPQFGSLFPDTDRYFGSMGSFFDLQFGGAGGDLPTQRAPSLTDSAAASQGCHVEVNPPFDTTLLRHMATHLLSCLARAQESAQSLLFLILLPSHDLTDTEKTAAAAVTSTQPPTTYQPTPTAAAKRLGSDCRCDSSAAAVVSTSAQLSTERILRESPYCLAHVLCEAMESAYVDGHQHLLQSPFFRIETPTRLILLGNAAARARFPYAAAQLESVRAAWKELTESALLPQC